MDVKNCLFRKLLIALCFVFLCLKCGSLGGQEPSGPNQQELLSKQWLKAVSNHNLHAAVAIANLLVSGNLSQPLAQHVAMADREGFRPSFFAAPFNFWDFQLWQHALFFQNLMRRITEGNPENVQAMFAAVRKKISADEKDYLAPPWPYVIWQSGFGICDRQAWVLCEIAYQAGWETQIVYLRDPVTKVSPHTICELRKGNGEVWFADPLYDILLQNKSVGEVVDDRSLLNELWDSVPKLRTALTDSLFLTPSYPQDYRPRNQELFKVLKKNLPKEECPRFGAAPQDRMSKYRELGAKTIFDPPRFPMHPWPYPFRLLRSDIMRYCKQFGIDFIKWSDS